MRGLLRRGDFRLLLGALLFTMFGDRALLLANGIWVKTLTGSNAAAGLTLLLIAAPSLVAPFLGVVIDRFRRRPFLIVLNVVCAVAIVPLLLVRTADQVWIVYVVSFLYGIAMILNDSAVGGVLKTMLDEDELAAANGVIQTCREGMRIAVPLAGAGLFAALGGHAVVVLDMVTLVAGAGVLLVLRLREPAPQPARHRFLAELTAGLRHVLLDAPVLRRAVLTAGVAFLVIGFAESAVYAVVDQGLHRPPPFVGVLMVAQGVGAIAGGVAAATVVRRTGELTAMAAGFALFATGDLLLVTGTLPVVLAGMVVAGSGLPGLLVGFYTLLQRTTPLHLMGRVGTATEVIIGVPQTVSIGVGALLIGFLDYRWLLATLGVVVFGCGVFLYATRHRGAVPPPPANTADVAEPPLPTEPTALPSE